MTAETLIAYLEDKHCPKDATVVICDQRTAQERETAFFHPQVIWWSDDRKTVYIGSI